jgi:hypothetical protein
MADNVKLEEVDARLQTPFTYLASGASQSGKTIHILNILTFRQILFAPPQDASKEEKANFVAPSNTIYYYHQWQSIFNEFQRRNLVTEFVNHLPTTEELNEKTLAFRDRGGSIVIIDDFVSQLTEAISDLFTVLCHANNINVFLLTQNIFHKNIFFRTISLNARYISIFKNPRDSSQITHFAKQFAPQNSRYIVDAYKECTKKPYTYMLFDHCQSTPDSIRVRSNFLPHEWPIRIWQPKSK